MWRHDLRVAAQISAQGEQALHSLSDAERLEWLRTHVRLEFSRF